MHPYAISRKYHGMTAIGIETLAVSFAVLTYLLIPLDMSKGQVTMCMALEELIRII